ncbi:HPP family protein [Halarcobacter ebronensis]|uniref:CBS domain-containing protein n=1 Tax=Halarcobacter ebronensis TaxID=1462615 RepID=A0A4Q1AP68_9BACT|nr:CBS domain-containing protein [Halarcobacter ebronensis]QKF82290.1 CBS domain-containing protein [Halarcobacter ebronensis]RXK07677.1 CBS domain-containing protein [Halarcobacter ebronensis]
MFAIYNNNGLSFRSTVDNLYTLSTVDSIARIRNNVEEGLPKNHTSTKNKNRLYNESSIDEATEVYKSIANIDTKVEIYHIKDLMTNDVLTLTTNNTLQEAYDLMVENDIRQIPIIDDTRNIVIAMLNERDILNYILGDLEFANSTLRKTLGTFDLKEVITADPITDIRRVAKVMVDFSLTAIPIVDQNDKLLGIVSRANILKAVSNTPPLQIWG